MLVQLAGIFAIVCYLLACGLLGFALAKKRPPSKIWILSLGSLALPAHGYHVLEQVYSSHGIDLGFFNILSLVGWITACIHIGVNSYRPLIVGVLFAYPTAALGLLSSILFHAPYQALTNLPRGAEGHIILSIFAYSVLFMAGLHALLLVIQNKSLKHRSKSRTILTIMPPLQTMESVLFDFIAVGFGLLSLAIASGFMSLDNMFAQHVVHKTILTLLAWTIFGTLLLGHYVYGWRGQRAIRFTLAGFLVLIFGFYGTKVVLELVLQKV
ncbi:cytochrome C assembly family protein [Agitococcus lubricus]|uniref:ABC-type uncharacterized transport system permease subunit n=1 Tax=Agitococcus lubricus TaxID=1077255 RepID=A0A2T5J2G3_9GAMM|nr:cytochrome c biogenesis protein CcsA [Agitococcus lubricus]PTQ90704.1 ABC-type uncharacterized transport system permease subunit [Agitococcus lubricus]